MRRHVHVVLAIVCAALGSTACAPQDGVPAAAAHQQRPPQGSAEVDPLPTLRLTQADLDASLPSVGDLLPWRVTVRCIRRASCTHMRGGDGRAATVLAEGRRRDDIPEILLIAVMRWPSEARAARSVQDSRREHTQLYEGRFRSAPVHLSPDRTRLGEVGQGHVTDMSPGGWTGWTGWTLDRTMRLVDRHGSRAPTVHEISCLLSRDRYSVQVMVRGFAGGTARLPVLRTLRREPTRQVRRLETIGTSARG